MKPLFPFLIFAMMLQACASNLSWTEAEKAVVAEPVPVRVLTIFDKADSIVLRTPCAEITRDDIVSDTYRQLEHALIETVKSPEQGGVGIAAPQIGISRRVIVVQRFDKEQEPFEAYPNVRITAVRGEKEPGGEGCLSIPGYRGNVLRYRDIDVQYTSPRTLKDTVERIEGFTAVIFQHETDHLDGVLYIDRLEGELLPSE